MAYLAYIPRQELQSLSLSLSSAAIAEGGEGREEFNGFRTKLSEINGEKNMWHCNACDFYVLCPCLCIYFFFWLCLDEKWKKSKKNGY